MIVLTFLTCSILSGNSKWRNVVLHLDRKALTPLQDPGRMGRKVREKREAHVTVGDVILVCSCV